MGEGPIQTLSKPNSRPWKLASKETDETIRGNFCEAAKKKTDLRIAMTNLLFPFVCKLKYHFEIGSIGQLKQLNLLPGTKNSIQK
jgi:hypothetical protein